MMPEPLLALLIPIAPNPGQGPDKTNVVTCSTCFIRCRSGSALIRSVEKTPPGDPSTSNCAILGHARHIIPENHWQPPRIAYICCNSNIYLLGGRQQKRNDLEFVCPTDQRARAPGLDGNFKLYMRFGILQVSILSCAARLRRTRYGFQPEMENNPRREG
jgi:hypothetical protein